METVPVMTETRSIAATRAIGWEEAVYILGLRLDSWKCQEILIQGTQATMDRQTRWS